MINLSDNINTLASFQDDINQDPISDTIGSYNHITSCVCEGCGTNGKANYTTGSNEVAQFNATNYKWSQASLGEPVTITYAFDDEFDLSGLTSEQTEDLFDDALDLWADYAPLDFVEVEDPGNGSEVDILVQDEFIDGSSGTLAYAYYPSGGDITFDNGEQWTESLYLETAVHEIGHSLGLGHEDGEEAIMNSILQGRYNGQSEPFLLEDDIEGIQALYGEGQGSVTALDAETTPEPSPNPNPTDDNNLVVNGSFENSPISQDNYGIFSQIDGWVTTSGSGIQVDKRTTRFGEAAEGSAWVELDSYNNSSMRQSLDTNAEQTYQLSFQYSSRAGNASSSNGIQVFWDDQLLDTITSQGEEQNEWQSYDYVVQGGGVNTDLMFKATGTSDALGGFMDDVAVLPTETIMTSVDPSESLTQGSIATSSDWSDPLLEQQGMLATGYQTELLSEINSQIASLV